MAGTITATTIQNDTSSPPTFKNNSVEIGRLCRAWVNYNGVTQTIIGSFNISSITYNATGNYSLNFTTAMPDANYATVGTGSNDGGGNNIPCSVNLNAGQLTTQVTVQVRDSGLGNVNRTVVAVAIFSS